MKKHVLFYGAVIAILLVILGFSAARLWKLHQRYSSERAVYEEFVGEFVHSGGLALADVNAFSGYDGEGDPADDTAPADTPDTLPAQVDTIYIDQNIQPVRVDWDGAKSVNSEIVAQIYCEGTQINYPVVQHTDNDYYLNHNVKGQLAECGAIFMGCANIPDFSDQNTVIHGHHMQDGSMFGSLDKWRNQRWFDRHRTFYIITPSQTIAAEAIATMEVRETSTAYQISFTSDAELQQWIESLVSESGVSTDYNFQEGDRFLTLSTCAYSFKDAKRVLICVIPGNA